ncbi:unnamed protein product [Lepeophtheirus salmonis]|uniref:(salmon louse) hypothetical protein n=1 Tax=Lepeophtheirus salmonis TaxID=72036 RepID=A0A7R8CKA1_LEPSM|nr:unnamed protein product [Lepeophtheirus salmonis]CAF2843682.1 unnamed protein product [Lepeophtheirus salmonis]
MKTREEQKKRNEGAIPKFISSAHVDETNITAEVRGNVIIVVNGDKVVKLEKKIQYDHDVDEADPPQITEEQNSNVDLKDMGMGPAMSNYSIREMLIQQGSKAVQNIDCEFKEVHCLKQAFDNAAVMAGHRSGIQARIREVNPNIVFCDMQQSFSEFSSCACSFSGCKFSYIFGTLDCLFAFFSASTRRWYILIEITGVTVKRPFITALERLMENVENATTSLWRDTLRDGTQKILQTKGLDLQQCTFKLIISLECFSTSKSRQNSGRCVGIFYRNLL